MLTLVLIACNQERLLKHHLSSYKSLIDSIQGTIIVIDDGSIDHTKDYILTHFDCITYMKNPKELGYVQSFNTVLAYIKTPYLLCIDLTIDVRFLPLQDAISYAKCHNIFMTGFSFSHHNKRFHGYDLTYQGFGLHFKPLSIPKNCFCCEIMLFDTTRLQKLHGLSSHYHSVAFSWCDLMYRAIKENETIASNDHGVCYKQSSLSTFFSYLPDQTSLFKDNFLFQWRFYRSFHVCLKRIISILLIFLSFKGSRILHFLQAYFQWLFFTKRSKNPSLKSFINRFFSSLFYPLTSSSSLKNTPILFTNHTTWDTSIVMCKFSFKSLICNISSPLFIDTHSLSRFTYYSLWIVDRALNRLCIKKLFYFVSSDYSLEHALAHYGSILE